jgi:uncharacterized protein (TIGR02646 family)
MIQLRPRPSCPPLLESKRVETLRASLERAFKRGKIKSAKYDSKIWRDDEVRLALYNYQNRKCCYCERPRDAKREPDIEHFRPKGAVSGSKKHAGYWWLAYEWTNLFFACKTCNQEHKKTQFPLRRRSKRATTPKSDLSKERPILPDLVSEDPLGLIGFDWNHELEEAWPIPTDVERGAQIIKVLGLDSKQLNEERGSQIAILLAAAQRMNCAQRSGEASSIKKAALEIEHLTRRDQPFVGFRRFYFSDVGLGQYTATD